MDNEIHLFQTSVSACPYLDNRSSCNHVIDPEYPLSPAKYEALLNMGFRRSASIVYRPACFECDECKSTRIPVSHFHPNRSQQRALKKAKDNLQVIERPASFQSAHYQLYQKYTTARHGDSDMKESSEMQYMEFLTSAWSDTVFIELHYDSKLLAVAVTDQQPNSLSALYTFFDPEKTHLSPGVLAILCQLEMAKKLDLDWLYLGYWVKDCQKMQYKTQYKPIQILEDGKWINLPSM